LQLQQPFIQGLSLGLVSLRWPLLHAGLETGDVFVQINHAILVDVKLVQAVLEVFGHLLEAEHVVAVPVVMAEAFFCPGLEKRELFQVY
jgi:hypothetical protein